MRLVGLILFLIARIAFSQIVVPSDKTVRLSGQWDFVPNKFIGTKDIGNIKSIPINVPGTWNKVKWNGKKFSGKGFGTYFLKLVIPDSIPDVILHVPSVGLAYKVFINDELIGQVGNPGTTRESTTPKIKPTTFHIPDQYMGQNVTLIFQVANFYHQNGGIWFSPQIGVGSHFRDNKLKSTIVNLLVLGSILIIMLYHFFIFILRPKEKYSLYFALVCLCMFAHIITQVDIALAHLLPELSWIILFKLTYSSLIMIGALNLKFIQTLYPRIIPLRLSRILIVISSFFATLTWIVSTSISYYFVLPFQILLVATGIYLIHVLVLASKRYMSGSRILLFGFSFTFLTAIHDILNSQFLIDSVSTIHYGVFIYVLTLSLVLAKKFIRFINSNERLQFELSGLNQELEQRVQTRTAELQSQKELVKNQNLRLEEANDELNELMAVLAHDLKSPLININSLAELLKNRLDSSLKQEGEMMQKIAKDGISMIESLISLKKLENEDVKSQKKRFDLTELMHLKVNEFGPQANIKGLNLIHEIESDISILSSERHISQIVDNLLSNAIKFSQPSTNIYLRAKINQNKLEICIKDQGPGFTERDKSKLFGKFERLSARPTAGESSSGLGLSIVKTLVEKLDGEIQLESDLNMGAEFKVCLPI